MENKEKSVKVEDLQNEKVFQLSFKKI